jgi:hypothetical protein
MPAALVQKPQTSKSALSQRRTAPSLERARLSVTSAITVAIERVAQNILVSRRI